MGKRVTHNAIAADLRTAKYRKRVVRSRVVYTRKVKHRKGLNDG